jgi:hypothetical protein
LTKPFSSADAEQNSSPLKANIVDINKHLYALFPPEYVNNFPSAWIEIAYCKPSEKPNQAEWFSVFDLQRAGEFAEEMNNDGHNVYVGAAFRAGDKPPSGRANDCYVINASHAWIDYEDEGDDDRIAGIVGEKDLRPSFIVTTGMTPYPRRHLYFKLDGGASAEKVRAANMSLIKLFDSDASVKNPSRVMRLAGTVSYPSPDKIGRGYNIEPVTFRAVPSSPSYSTEHIIGLTANAGSSSGSTGDGERKKGPRSDEEIAALLKLSQEKGKWHCSMRDVVASLVGRGWSDSAIKFACHNYCFDGRFDADLIKLIDTARVKFDKPNPSEEHPQETEPLPLLRELPEAEPYPVEALGPILEPVARAICDITQAPMALCGQAVLGAVSLVVQPYADVKLLAAKPGPISLYMLSIAESGERKTAVDGLALQAVRTYQRELRERHETEMAAYKVQKAAYERACKVAEKVAKGDYAATVAALSAIPEPVRPLEPILMCSEPTWEGLFKLLDIGQSFLGLFSDEGASFIGGFAMMDDAIKRTAGGFSDLWNGTPLTRTRAGDGASILEGRRFAVHLMTQPNIAADLLANKTVQGQGLLARFIIAAPASTIGSRPYREPNPASEVTLRRFENLLLSILRRPLPLAAGCRNELAPPTIHLSPEAKTPLIEFSDYADAEAKEGKFASIKPLAIKSAEHAGRIAANLALIADIEARDISEAQIKDGIVLARHNLSEALRLYEAGRERADLILAQQLLDWLLKRGEAIISLVDIYRLGPRDIRDKDTAEAMVRILLRHGRLRKVEGGATIDGIKHREVYRLKRGGGDGE